MKEYIFRIGILNAESGKAKIEKETNQGEALKVAEKISRWFDKQDTFFSGTPIWKYWKIIGILSKFEAVVSGNSLGRVAAESVAVFHGNKTTEHGFFIERKES